jgi:hypothetical protein
MKAAAAQIAFRYRPQDSATGVTRTTTKRLAEVLGVDETQVIQGCDSYATSGFLMWRSKVSAWQLVVEGGHLN